MFKQTIIGFIFLSTLCLAVIVVPKLLVLLLVVIFTFILSYMFGDVLLREYYRWK